MDLTDYLKILGYAGILAFILTWAWGMNLMLRDPNQGSDSESKKTPKRRKIRKDERSGRPITPSLPALH
jgi:hypothetical protein